MKRLRFPTGVGSGEAVIPDGQIHLLSVIALTTAPTWVSIAGSDAIFLPAGSSLLIGAEDFGFCCSVDKCDMYPGEQQITIAFGDKAVTGSEGPASWLVIYNGSC